MKELIEKLQQLELEERREFGNPEKPMNEMVLVSKETLKTLADVALSVWDKDADLCKPDDWLGLSVALLEAATLVYEDYNMLEFLGGE